MVNDLVCANCARPVMEGHCALCRASREQLSAAGPPTWLLLSLLMLAAIIAVVLALRPA